MTAGEKNGDEKPSSTEVSWDGEDDQLNPMNWKASKKWLNLLIISVMAFITYVRRETQCTQSSGHS